MKMLWIHGIFCVIFFNVKTVLTVHTLPLPWTIELERDLEVICPFGSEYDEENERKEKGFLVLYEQITHNVYCNVRFQEPTEAQLICSSGTEFLHSMIPMQSDFSGADALNERIDILMKLLCDYTDRTARIIEYVKIVLEKNRFAYLDENGNCVKRDYRSGSTFNRLMSREITDYDIKYIVNEIKMENEKFTDCTEEALNALKTSLSQIQPRRKSTFLRRIASNDIVQDGTNTPIKDEKIEPRDRKLSVRLRTVVVRVLDERKHAQTKEIPPESETIDALTTHSKKRVTQESKHLSFPAAVKIIGRILKLTAKNKERKKSE